jgi:hypothetical protein
MRASDIPEVPHPAMKTLAALLLALPLVATAQAGTTPPAAPPATARLPAADPVQMPEPAPEAPPPPARAPYTRDSWYLGAGFGTGLGASSGTGSDAGTLTTMGIGSVTNLVFNLKGGMTLTPHLLVGLDVIKLRSSSATGDWQSALNVITNYDAMVTWFPWQRGLLLRGGLGYSVLDRNLTRYPGYGLETYLSYGANLTAGAGYAFWLGETFNLSVVVDASAQHYFSTPATPFGSTITGTGLLTLWAGVDWY